MSLDAATVRRNRLMLLAIFAIFFGSLLFAGLLRFSGWRPAGSKNHGELLQPPGDLRKVVPLRRDGKPYAWNPVERTWRIALAPPATCTTECVELAREISLVWQLFGKDADKVHVLSQGRIVRSGGRELALELEEHGYGWIDTAKSGKATGDTAAGASPAARATQAGSASSTGAVGARTGARP